MMIKAKNRNYYIQDYLIKKVFRSSDNRYWGEDSVGNQFELDEIDYVNLGGGKDNE